MCVYILSTCIRRREAAIMQFYISIPYVPRFPMQSEPVVFPWIKINKSCVQFSRSVVSNSLRPHELQHARPPCPSPTPGVHPDSCASSRWCHPAISSSVVPFSSHLQSFQDQGLFKLVSSSHQVAKLLEFQLQHQSFQWIFRTDFL